MQQNDLPELSDFPLVTTDKVRYRDTDAQGHVNNAVFSTFLETGRVEVLYDPEAPLAEPGASFVIASLHLDFLHEIRWPGTVTIGTRVRRLGKSSVTIDQGVFQHDRIVARAETVIVQVDDVSHRSSALGDGARARLEALITERS